MQKFFVESKKIYSGENRKIFKLYKNEWNTFSCNPIEDTQGEVRYGTLGKRNPIVEEIDLKL